MDRVSIAEADIRARLGHLSLDFPALMAVSNIYRSATAIRNKIEGEVLSQHGLSWGGFTILFVLWVWGSHEAAALADECGLAKGTLSGMVDTLERRDLVKRDQVAGDRRRVNVTLTDSGSRLIEEIFPAFNAVESEVVSSLEEEEIEVLSRLLRTVTNRAG